MAIAMKCDVCHKEQSKSSLRTITFESKNEDEKLEGKLCRACYEKATKLLEKDEANQVVDMLREANGKYDYQCEICGQKRAGESIYLELPDREIRDCGCALSICPGCLDKIWLAIDNIAENKQ